ncbi:hypothetical protein AC062_1769 [Pasteurellaceae bacterium NI1060]|nr:hypothetical protein AC062_1769 [Pasteurellaceae bacterium NI1060]
MSITLTLSVKTIKKTTALYRITVSTIWRYICLLIPQIEGI